MTPRLDAIVVAWRATTRAARLVRSIRAGSHGRVRTIVVVNEAGAAAADLDADVVVRSDANLGYAGGLNLGLAHVDAPLVVFMNDDLVVPDGWDLPLTEPLLRDGRVGAVVPALTAAGLSSTVRPGPTEESRALAAFEFASGACLAARTEQIGLLGGWPTLHGLLGGEDLDLQLQLWINGLATWFEGRVCVEHVSKASAGDVAWRAHWHRSGRSLLRSWATDRTVPRLGVVPDEVVDDRREQARRWASREHRRLLLRPGWWAGAVAAWASPAAR